MIVLWMEKNFQSDIVCNFSTSVLRPSYSFTLEPRRITYNPINKQTISSIRMLSEENWQQQLADELHKPIKRNFTRRRIITNGIDKIWCSDLVEMQQFS